MQKQSLHLVCQVIEIGPIKSFERANKSTFTKRMLTLKTEDNQVLYCELRKMNLLDNIPSGSIVDVFISFHGSERNGKQYNNIFINQILKR